MTDAYDRLEHAAERIIDRSDYEMANRRGLLWVHAVMGMLAGVQMLLWGSASTIEAAVGVWVRPIMAVLGVTGGLLLAYGLTRRPRSIPFEAVGLALVGMWDLAMTAGLAYARLKQHDFALVPLGEKIPYGYVVAYPTTIYAGLFVLITIHLWTLRRLRRSERHL